MEVEARDVNLGWGPRPHPVGGISGTNDAAALRAPDGLDIGRATSKSQRQRIIRLRNRCDVTYLYIVCDIYVSSQSCEDQIRKRKEEMNISRKCPMTREGRTDSSFLLSARGLSVITASTGPWPYSFREFATERAGMN